MSRRYLVTGGAGFIGSHLVEHLLQRGDGVVVLDDFSTGSRDNLAELGGDLTVIEDSVTSAAALEKATERVDGIFHLAAVPSVVRSVEAPLETNDINVTGTVQVLQAARRRKLRVVYAGSSSAYGDDPTPLKHEELREDPISPYAVSKLAGELYCRSFARVFGLPVVVLRFFNVFGPRQVADNPYSGVVAAFCFALLRADQGVRPRIDGSGQQTRDFTYVTDVALGCRLAMEAPLEGDHLINLAAGGRCTIQQLFDELVAYTGIDVEPLRAPARAGDIEHSEADVTRSRELLGFEPQVSFAEGLQRTFDWYRSTFR